MSLIDKIEAYLRSLGEDDHSDFDMKNVSQVTPEESTDNMYAVDFTKENFYINKDGKELRIGGWIERENDGVWEKQIDPFMGKSPRRMIQSESLDSNPQVYLGYYSDPIGNATIEGFNLEAWRRHAVMFAKTGYGKSTLLKNVAGQIAKHNLNFTFMTPKEDDILEILSILPEEELDKTDIVRPNATETDKVISYNLFDLTEEEKREHLDHKVDTFITLLLSKFSQTGARLEPTSRTIAKTMMMSDKNYSLADFITVITDQEKLQTFIENIDDEFGEGSADYKVKPERLDNIGEYEVDDQLEPIANRLQQFSDRKALRNMFLQQESDINFDDYVSGDRNLILDLKETPDKEVFGMLFVRELWLAALKRGELDTPETFVLNLIDEFNSIINEANYKKSKIQDVFSKSRAYNFGIFVASQYSGQLPSELLTEVTENTEIKIAAKTEDGYMANYINDTDTQKVSRDDVKQLSKYQAYIQQQPEEDNTEPPAKLINNFADMPPLRDMKSAIEVRKNMVNNIGSNPVTQNSKQISIIGEESVTNTSTGSGSDSEDEENMRLICQAVDVAQKFYKYNYSDYSEHPTRDKAEYVDEEIVKDALGVIGFEYGYNDFDQFLENNGYYFTTRVKKDATGNKVTQLGLTVEGEKLAGEQNSGSSASGGKAAHRILLNDIRDELAKYGVIVYVPEQDGEMSDGIGYMFRDIGNETVYKLLSEGDSNKIMIEAESTTESSQPNQTVRNLSKIMKAGNKTVFVLREQSEAERNENRLLNNNGYAKKYSETEYLLYTLSGTSDYLKETSVTGTTRYPVRPMKANASKTTRWIHRTSADTDKQYVLQDSEQYEYAQLSLDELANDNWNLDDFPAYYYREDNTYIVKQDGEVVGKYESKSDMKDEWMTIKKPRIPEYEFADTGYPTQSDLTHIVCELDKDAGGSGETYIYKNGQKHYFNEDKSETQRNTRSPTETSDNTEDSDNSSSSNLKDKLDF
jgi:energy-coupling factor transporter ATP-binding protein EcfA2